jgi:hypothetical protein
MLTTGPRYVAENANQAHNYMPQRTWDYSPCISLHKQTFWSDLTFSTRIYRSTSSSAVIAAIPFRRNSGSIPFNSINFSCKLITIFCVWNRSIRQIWTVFKRALNGNCTQQSAYALQVTVGTCMSLRKAVWEGADELDLTSDFGPLK